MTYTLCLQRIKFCMRRLFVVDLTHTVTHTRKKAGGVNGRESVKDHAPPQQKRPESAKQRHSQSIQSLGKDEVPSSNLGSSSKIPLELLDSGGISLVFAIFSASLFLRFFVDPHRDPHGEMSGEGQRVPDRKFRLPAWLFCRFF